FRNSRIEVLADKTNQASNFNTRGKRLVWVEQHYEIKGDGFDLEVCKSRISIQDQTQALVLKKTPRSNFELNPMITCLYK
ncbi:unnamed protein product, partial [Linum tenue]